MAKDDKIYRPNLGQSGKDSVEEIRNILMEIGFNQNHGTGQKGAVSDADVIRYCIEKFSTLVESVVEAKGKSIIMGLSIKDLEESLDEMMEIWVDVVEDE